MTTADHIGLLNIFKSPGMSSHEVVNQVRRIAGMKRVGHTGTLDPSACGVLPICLGPATRLADYISAGPKAYRAEFLLGVTTDSDDAEGDITARHDAGQLREDEILTAMRQFTGTLQQRPPDRSAVWIEGRRAYDLALKGEKINMPLREVTVYAFTPVRLLPGVHQRLLADVTVSKGTYIRSLARDLGNALGVGATLSFLARTKVGGCHIEEAVSIDELRDAAAAGEFARWVQAPDSPLDYIPDLRLDAGGGKYRLGTDIPVVGEPGLYRVYFHDKFFGLGRIADDRLRPVVNLYPPPPRH